MEFRVSGLRTPHHTTYALVKQEIELKRSLNHAPATCSAIILIDQQGSPVGRYTANELPRLDGDLRYLLDSA